MSERTRKRLDQLNNLRADVEFCPEVFGDRLETALQALRDLTGDTERDVSRVEAELDEGGSGFLFEGFSPEGTRRFWCVIYYEVATATLDINIAVTKGTQAASEDSFGQSGQDYGNRAMVARAFDVLLATGIECGVQCLRNKPWDERVRAIYAAMGFENGERLDLGNSDQLRLAVGYIEAAYELAETVHEGFKAAW